MSDPVLLNKTILLGQTPEPVINTYVFGIIRHKLASNYTLDKSEVKQEDICPIKDTGSTR
ncbi:hypothetical protein CHS0354_013409, partial [Potamilus streckersoni]